MVEQSSHISAAGGSQCAFCGAGASYWIFGADVKSGNNLRGPSLCGHCVSIIGIFAERFSTDVTKWEILELGYLLPGRNEKFAV